jgi:hypothetical protein
MQREASWGEGEQEAVRADDAPQLLTLDLRLAPAALLEAAIPTPTALEPLAAGVPALLWVCPHSPVYSLAASGALPGNYSGVVRSGTAMAFKLIESAQDRWRAVNGSHLVALVRAGATFRKGGTGREPDRGSGGRVITREPDPQLLTIPPAGGSTVPVIPPS